MNRVFLAAIGLAVAVASVPINAHASGICISGTSLKVLIAQGACTFDSFTLNFGNAQVSGNPAPSVGTTAAQIAANTIVYLSSTGIDNLDVAFDPAKSGANYLNFAAVSKKQATFNYHYTVTLPSKWVVVYDSYTIHNAFQTIDPTVVATVTGFKEINAGLSGPQTSAEPLMGAKANKFQDYFGELSFSGQQSPFTVEDSLTILQSANGNISKVGDGTHRGSLENYFVFQAVPEPLTIAFAGAGLLGIGLMRRRRS